MPCRRARLQLEATTLMPPPHSSAHREHSTTRTLRTPRQEPQRRRRRRHWCKRCKTRPRKDPNPSRPPLLPVPSRSLNHHRHHRHPSLPSPSQSNPCQEEEDEEENRRMIPSPVQYPLEKLSQHHNHHHPLLLQPPSTQLLLRQTRQAAQQDRRRYPFLLRLFRLLVLALLPRRLQLRLQPPLQLQVRLQQQLQPRPRPNSRLIQSPLPHHHHKKTPSPSPSPNPTAPSAPPVNGTRCSLGPAKSDWSARPEGQRGVGISGPGCESCAGGERSSSLSLGSFGKTDHSTLVCLSCVRVGITSRGTRPSIQQGSNASPTSQFTSLSLSLLPYHSRFSLSLSRISLFARVFNLLTWFQHPFFLLPSPPLLFATHLAFRNPQRICRAISASKTPLPTLSLHAAARGGSSILYSQNPDLLGNTMSDDENGGEGGGGGGGERLVLTESGRPKRSRAAMTRG